MPPEWNDRFDESTFALDEPVRVYRCDQDGTDEGGLWVPERIWHRCRCFGLAYELHLLPLLDGSTDPVFLNAAQVDQLLHELRFVACHVVDPLVEVLVGSVVQLAGQPPRDASTDMFGFEFP